MNIKMPPTALSGQFRMVVSKDPAEKEVVSDTGFFHNLIVNTGMNHIGTANINPSNAVQAFILLCGRFVVGSGSSAPMATDTSLDAPVAYASSEVSVVSESCEYERGWYEVTVMFQFGQGVAAGNLSEIGIQRSSASGPLWSRALILDPTGTPTTITVLDTDYLTCYYTLRVMIPKQDAVFNIDVDYGDEGIVPTVVTVRPLNADSASGADGWDIQPSSLTNNNHVTTAFSGGLVDPTARFPAGGQVGSGGGREAVPYVQNSFERYVNNPLTLAQMNSTTLATFKVLSLMGVWQVNFDPPLQKNNTQTMQLTFGYSWARA